jgi:hypothetical protein
MRFLARLVDHFASSSRAFHGQNTILFTAQLVIIYEKFFELELELLTEIIDVPHFLKTVVVTLDSHDPIVSLFLLLASLLSFDDPNDAAT